MKLEELEAQLRTAFEAEAEKAGTGPALTDVLAKARRTRPPRRPFYVVLAAATITAIALTGTLITGIPVVGFKPVLLGERSRPSAAASASASAPQSASSSAPSASMSSAPARPLLGWDSYRGVHLGDSMTSAARALGGKVINNMVYKVGGVEAPKPAQCGGSGEELISGITPGVHVVSETGGPNAVVSWISFDRGVGVGPLGIASGMTLAQARSVSGQPLIPRTNPATGRDQYELPHGTTTFAFVADPLVSELTIVTSAELAKGGIFDGGVSC